MPRLEFGVVRLFGAVRTVKSRKKHVKCSHSEQQLFFFTANTYCVSPMPRPKSWSERTSLQKPVRRSTSHSARPSARHFTCGASLFILFFFVLHHHPLSSAPYVGYSMVASSAPGGGVQTMLPHMTHLNREVSPSEVSGW